jgi:hypothetical protein
VEKEIEGEFEEIGHRFSGLFCAGEDGGEHGVELGTDNVDKELAIALVVNEGDNEGRLGGGGEEEDA